jgi:hypothetical protein
MSVDDHLGSTISLHEIVRTPKESVSRLPLQIRYGRIKTTMNAKGVWAAVIHLERLEEGKVVLGHGAEEQLVGQCHSLVKQARPRVLQG